MVCAWVCVCVCVCVQVDPPLPARCVLVYRTAAWELLTLPAAPSGRHCSGWLGRGGGRRADWPWAAPAASTVVAADGWPLECDAGRRAGCCVRRRRGAVTMVPWCRGASPAAARPWPAAAAGPALVAPGLVPDLLSPAPDRWPPLGGSWRLLLLVAAGLVPDLPQPAPGRWEVAVGSRSGTGPAAACSWPLAAAGRLLVAPAPDGSWSGAGPTAACSWPLAAADRPPTAS